MKKLVPVLLSVLVAGAVYADPTEKLTDVSAPELGGVSEVAGHDVAESPDTGSANQGAMPKLGGVSEVAGHDVAESLDTGSANQDAAPSPWWRGIEFGVGVPLVTPLTGYNGFIGYANKKAESFFGKRLGARLDFQIADALSASAKLANNGNGYDVTAKLDVLFWSGGIDKIPKIDIPKLDPIKFDDQNFDLSGATAVVAMKNQNIGALIDFYPFGNTWFLGGIRLSGGYYTGRMDMNVSAGNFPNSELSFDIDGNGPNTDKVVAKIKNGSKIAANFKWKYSGPYLGLGFDLGVVAGFKFYMDAGVVFAKPPKVSRQDNIQMPVLQACYTSGTGCSGDWIDFNLNEKPDIGDLTTDILGQVIKAQIPSIDPAVQGEIANALGVSVSDLNNADFGGLATDVLDYLNGGTPTPGGWLDKLTDNLGAEYNSDIASALDVVKDNWGGNGADFSGDLQSNIDQAWNDYEKGINDINNSLKNMKFMPVVKLGVMYRF